MTPFTIRIITPKQKRLELHGPADITHETCDAIVNAANSSLLGGGGVDGAIHRAGGPSILEECRRFVAASGPLPAGKAMLTGGGGLTARYVIHTVGPVYCGGAHGEPETLASCYREAIRIGEASGIRSIAFPAISTGAYGYPAQEAAEIAVSTVMQVIAGERAPECVRFVLFDGAMARTYIRAAEDWVRNNPEFRLERATGK